MNMNMRTQNIGEVSMVKYKGFGDLKWFQGAGGLCGGNRRGIGIGDLKHLNCIIYGMSRSYIPLKGLGACLLKIYFP